MYDDVVTHTFGCVCVWGNQCMPGWYTGRNGDTFCCWYFSGRRCECPWVGRFILFKNLCAFFFLVVYIRFASFIFHLLSKLYCWYFCNSPPKQTMMTEITAERIGRRINNLNIGPYLCNMFNFNSFLTSSNGMVSALICIPSFTNCTPSYTIVVPAGKSCVT